MLLRGHILGGGRSGELLLPSLSAERVKITALNSDTVRWTRQEVLVPGNACFFTELPPAHPATPGEAPPGPQVAKRRKKGDEFAFMFM